MRLTFGFWIGVLAANVALAQAAPVEQPPAAMEKAEKEGGTVKVGGAGSVTLSGYIQGRYTDIESSSNTSVNDGFGVRRARIKVSYKPVDWTSLVLQIDGATSGTILKDAEVHLVEPWTGQKWELVAGQMKWPFGYEVLQSSSDREMPERSRVIRAFFPNERDRGAKIAGKLGPAQLQFGVYDGNGIDYRLPNGSTIQRDNDTYKDIVARISTDLGPIAGGISGKFGRTFDPGVSGPTGRPGTGFHTRNRVGADLQLTLPLLGIGRSILRAEAVRGETPTIGNQEQFGIPAFGWYANFTQEVGAARLTARYDWFDGHLGQDDVVNGGGLPSSQNAVGTLGFAASYTFVKVVKLTAAYELVHTAAPEGIAEPKDNIFTLQLQGRY